MSSTTETTANVRPYAVLCIDHQGDHYIRCAAACTGDLREAVLNELYAMMTEIDGDALVSGAQLGEMHIDRVAGEVVDWTVYDEFERGDAV